MNINNFQLKKKNLHEGMAYHSYQEWQGPGQVKNCFRTCTTCADSHHPAHTKSQQGIGSPFIHSVVFNDFISGQWRPWSDCMNVQADLGLRCPHMPKDTFSHGPAKNMHTEFTLCAMYQTNRPKQTMYIETKAKCHILQCLIRFWGIVMEEYLVIIMG